MTSVLVDATTIDDARRGDEQAFCALAGAFWSRLVGLARGIVGEDSAEDVVQEALVDAWRGITTLTTSETAYGWLRRIVIRRAVRHARRRRLLEVLWLPARALPADPDGALDAERLLASLPPRQRAVMVLTAVDGATDSEIAAELGITPASVRSHRRRARETLRRQRGPDHGRT